MGVKMQQLKYILSLSAILMFTIFSKILEAEETRRQMFNIVSDAVLKTDVFNNDINLVKSLNDKTNGDFVNNTSIDRNNDNVKLLLNSRSLGDVHFGTFDAAALSNMFVADDGSKPVLSWDGPLAGAELSLIEISESINGFKGLTSSLELEGNHGDLAFVLFDDAVAGVINYEGQTYHVKHLYDSWHAFVKLNDQNNLRSLRSFVDDIYQDSERSDQSTLSMSQYNQTFDNQMVCPDDNVKVPQTEIDIVVGFTPLALKKSLAEITNIKVQIVNSTVISNLGLSKSKINAKFRIKEIFQVDYKEVGSPRYFESDMKNFKQKNGQLKLLHEKRKSLNADIAILVVNDDNPGRCGIAAGIDVEAEDGLAIVNWRCMTNKLSYAHEVGHLIGARHDNDPRYPAHAHGFFVNEDTPPVSFCTVMATQNSCMQSRSGRIWNWSNPFVIHEGLPTGTINRNNNACVWNENVKKISEFNGG